MKGALGTPRGIIMPPLNPLLNPRGIPPRPRIIGGIPLRIGRPPLPRIGGGTNSLSSYCKRNKVYEPHNTISYKEQDAIFNKEINIL